MFKAVVLRLSLLGHSSPTEILNALTAVNLHACRCGSNFQNESCGVKYDKESKRLSWVKHWFKTGEIIRPKNYVSYVVS